MFLRAVNNNLISMCETVAEQPVVLKICTRCHVAKPVGEFSKNGGKKDGLACWCKECHAKANKARHEKNKARDVVVIPEFKTCSGCKTKMPSSEFHKNKNSTDGLQGCCKECDAKKHKAHQEKNKARDIIVIPDFKTCPGCEIEKLALAFDKNKSNKDGLCGHCKDCMSVSERKRKYGASPEWQKETLEAQGGACAICRFVPGPGDLGLCLDHKHEVGPRGFLHGNCNFGIGCFKDSVELIGKAIEYLNGPTTGIVYKKHLSKAIRDKILAGQNGLCKICSVDLSTVRACVDHDHLTNMIRGILCHGCNCGLGKFDDSIILLTNAIGYLIRYETDNNLNVDGKSSTSTAVLPTNPWGAA
jgi:Recombination endonuclease VII.